MGAYGGRKDIMEMVAPAGPMYQAGTLSGNPLAMTAGIKVRVILLPLTHGTYTLSRFVVNFFFVYFRAVYLYGIVCSLRISWHGTTRHTLVFSRGKMMNYPYVLSFR